MSGLTRPHSRPLLARLTAEYREGLIEDHINIETLIESVDDRQVLAEIHTRDLECEYPTVHEQHGLQTLYRNYLNQRKKELEQTIAQADRASNEQLLLMQEVKEIRKQLVAPLQIQL